MANYYESARTNYVKVKDVDAFREFCKLYGATVSPSGMDEGPRAGKVCILWDEGFNQTPYDWETNEEIEGDFFADVPAHLVEGEVLVMMASGHEKLRYITGYAGAVDSTGKTVFINIDQIYQLAVAQLGVKEIDGCNY